MAKIKKKPNRLGSPPKPDNVLNTLAEPESAPAKKIDGRTLRKTGMTQQFNTRVSKGFLKKLKAEARAQDSTQGRVMAIALDFYLENK